MSSQFWKLLLAERFTQVVDSNPWVRCASGNVCLLYKVDVINAPMIMDDMGSINLHTLRKPLSYSPTEISMEDEKTKKET